MLRYLKFFVLLSLVTLILIYIIPNEEMRYKIEHIKIEHLEEPVYSWVLRHKDEEGIYIGSMQKTRKVEEYYLYFNKPNIYTVGIGHTSTERNTIKISTINDEKKTINDLNIFTISVTKITTLNRHAKTIDLDSKKFNVNEIEVIK
jgi:hypothetical protein